jgi:hypothetical protein
VDKISLNFTFLVPACPGLYLGGTKSNLRGTKSNLRGTKSNLRGTKSNLRGTKSNLRGTKSNLRGTKSNLRGTMTYLGNAIPIAIAGQNWYFIDTKKKTTNWASH